MRLSYFFKEDQTEIIKVKIKEFTKNGGKIKVFPKQGYCPRLLFSNGHFHAKKSKGGKGPRGSDDLGFLQCKDEL
jgi:hypothetical protein